MKVALRLRRQSRRHLVQHVYGLVHPAPLFPGRAIDLSESGPEAQGPVIDGELPWLREPPLLEVEEQFLLSRTPSMMAISSFWPFGRGSHEDEQALLLVALVFQPRAPRPSGLSHRPCRHVPRGRSPLHTPSLFAASAWHHHGHIRTCSPKHWHCGSRRRSPGPGTHPEPSRSPPAEPAGWCASEPMDN